MGILGDEETLLVYKANEMRSGLEGGQDGTGQWAFEELGYPIDSRHWETSLTERFDGRERVFVSDRPGGQGGAICIERCSSRWHVVRTAQLGSRINTPGRKSPVLSADGRFLCSPQRTPGNGGFDLFRCVRLDNGSWSDRSTWASP